MKQGTRRTRARAAKRMNVETTLLRGNAREVYRFADFLWHQNGNYPDPSLTSALPVKRQFRDPYGGW